jgi:hypothetical protein
MLGMINKHGIPVRLVIRSVFWNLVSGFVKFLRRVSVGMLSSVMKATSCYILRISKPVKILCMIEVLLLTHNFSQIF